MITRILISLCLLMSLTAAKAIADDTPYQQMRAHLQDVEGVWTGKLEYRDYQTDKITWIPHERTYITAPDGSYMFIRHDYTDPGFKVYSGEMLHFHKENYATAVSHRGAIVVNVAEVTAFARTEDGWTATVFAEGEDDLKPAMLRFSWTLRGDKLTIQKDVKPEGEVDFAFRNRVLFTRK